MESSLCVCSDPTPFANLCLILKGVKIADKKVAELALEIVRIKVSRKYFQEQGRQILFEQLFQCSLGTLTITFFLEVTSCLL